MIKVFSKLFKHKPERKPSPLLLEMETVNENLQQIAALLASQKPTIVNATPGTPDTSGFEPFEPFETPEATEV